MYFCDALHPDESVFWAVHSGWPLGPALSLAGLAPQHLRLPSRPNEVILNELLERQFIGIKQVWRKTHLGLFVIDASPVLRTWTGSPCRYKKPDPSNVVCTYICAYKCRDRIPGRLLESCRVGTKVVFFFFTNTSVTTQKLCVVKIIEKHNISRNFHLKQKNISTSHCTGSFHILLFKFGWFYQTQSSCPPMIAPDRLRSQDPIRSHVVPVTLVQENDLVSPWTRARSTRLNMFIVLFWYSRADCLQGHRKLGLNAPLPNH